MRLEAKTIVARDQDALERILQRFVAKGWQRIDNPSPILHDGKARNGDQLVLHLQRRT